MQNNYEDIDLCPNYHFPCALKALSQVICWQQRVGNILFCVTGLGSVSWEINGGKI